MVQFQNNFVQDLTQKCPVRTDCGLVAFNADNLSNVVSVALYNGEEAYTGGGTVVGAVVCPDGATVALDGTLSGNVASITLTGDCFALQGQIGVSIQIVSGDVRTTVLKAIYNVDVSSTDTIVDPGSRITLSLAEIEAKLDEIPTILANAQTAIDGIEAQKDTMIASIASVAGQGTDTTLTQSGVAADAKATGDQVRDLKSAIESTINAVLELIESPNLINFNDPEYLTGKYISNGTVYNSSSYNTSGYIPVEVGETYTYTYGNVVGTPMEMRFITAYNANKQVVTSACQESKKTYTVPADIAFLRFSADADYFKPQTGNLMFFKGTTIDKYYPYWTPYYLIKNDVLDEDYLKQVSEGVVQDTIDESFQTVDFAKLIRFTPSLTPNYYMGTNGVPVSNSDYSYSQAIDVLPGDIVRARRTDGAINTAMRFVCAYSDGTAVSSKGKDTQVFTYTVPDGIDQVVVTVTKSNNVDAIDIYREADTLFAKTEANSMGFLKATGDISDGESLAIPYENVKNNVVLVFSCRVTSFNSITIGKNASRRYITLDSTQLTVNDGTNTYTVDHGLTISDDVSVTLESTDATDYLKRITIESKGEVYTYTNNSCRFESQNGYYTVVSSGSVLTDCVFSWTSRNVNNKLWMFGDSYFSITSDRWVYYLLNDGFTSALISGYSGENAQTAIKGFKNLLSARVPENILWCLGMNNGDENSAVNSNWKQTYDELVNLSKEYGFNLILATIPNTPEVDNEYKNAIVRDSGYQYIDFAAAVNVGNDGSWISGALSTDNVHPTAKGAKILYRRALADCPQLASAE